MKIFKRQRARLFATLAIALGVAPVVTYGSSTVNGAREANSVIVRYNDLDVSSEHGAKTLYLRLRNASQTVCDDDGDILKLFETAVIVRCEQQAVENAVAQVNRPQLTALYNKRYPRETLAPVAVSFTSHDGLSASSVSNSSNEVTVHS